MRGFNKLDSVTSELVKARSKIQGLNKGLSKISKQVALLQQDKEVPVSIFSGDVPPLEALVKFLVENQELSITNISRRLNRNFKTIWTTYKNSQNKRLPTLDSLYFAPLVLFAKDRLSILESLVSYLHNDKKLEFYKIALLLRKDIRTIWTCNKRSEMKLKKIIFIGGKNEYKKTTK